MFKKLGRREKESTVFPDKRLEKRYHQVNELLDAGQSSVLNRITLKRSERKGAYDFFKNYRVNELILKEKVYEGLKRQEKRIKGEHLLVLEDTVEYNFASNSERIRDFSGMGALSNERGLGFLSHVSLALNASDLSVLGISDIQMWHRKADRPGAATRKQRNFEEKESYKWHVGIYNSHQRLSEAKKITYVQDRDGDIYESLSRVKQIPKAELLVRNCRDRRIELRDGNQVMLYDYLKKEEVFYSYEVKIAADKRVPRKERIAQLDVRSVRVKLVCPESLKRKNSPYVEVDVVWVSENASTVPQGETGVDWKLITTHKVLKEEELLKQTIRWYGNRWLIEEFFLSQKQEPTTWKMLYWKQGMAYAS